MQNARFIYDIVRMFNQERWVDYGTRFPDNVASHSFRSSVLCAMAAILEEKLFGNKVDKARLVCGGLFHDFDEIENGSIKHETKKDDEVEPHIEELRVETGTKQVNYLSKELRPIFREFIVNAEDDSYEGRILKAVDTLDAMLYCHREMTRGGDTFFFPGKYEELKGQLKKVDIPSIQWMLAEFEKGEDSGFYQFIYKALLLDRVKRWKGKFNHVPDDDATHTYRVACYTVFNAYKEIVEHGKQIDVFRAVCKTLFHDYSEAEGGDINGPVKHSTPARKAAFARYERKIAINMLALLPEFMREPFMDYMVDAKDDSYEGHLVEIADKLDALIKMLLEKKYSIEYEVEYHKLRRAMQHKYRTPSVEFFFAYVLHDLQYPIFED